MNRAVVLYRKAVVLNRKIISNYLYMWELVHKSHTFSKRSYVNLSQQDSECQSQMFDLRSVTPIERKSN